MPVVYFQFDLFRSHLMSLDRIYNGLYGLQKRAEHTIGSVFHNLKNYRNDLDLFERVCAIAVEILHLSGKAEHFPTFKNTLCGGNMHAFYKFFRRPYHFFYPISVNSIDIPALQQELRSMNLDGEWKQFVDTELARFLVKISGPDSHDAVAFENSHLFLEKLQNWLLAADIQKNYQELNVMDLLLQLKRKSLPSKIISLLGLMVETGTVFFCFNRWNLLSTTAVAAQIGRIPLFTWVKNTSLEKNLKGTACFASLFKVYESLRELSDERIGAIAKVQLRWDLGVSSADAACFGMQYLYAAGKLNLPLPWMHLIALVNDLIGVVSILNRPKQPIIAALEVPYI